MTIKELETSLGMTRANIRFYEQEGFLTPQRGENNYRIYSQEDVDTLRKIKLLRQLGLPLDTIRQVQQGAVPLDTALARRQLALEEERAELAWADWVCSAMRSDRAEYATLDAEKYLNALDRPAEGEGYFSLKKDSAPMVAYPWRRFFARWLDLFVYGLLWTAFGALVLRINLPDIWILRLLSTYLNYLTMLVVEPILLATWGYTPGKWIFGLQVRDRDGGKISWRDAKNRTWLVFAKGDGYGIPFYNLYRNYKSYKACVDCETLPWEEECGYAIKDESGLRCLGFVGATAALFALTFLVALQAQMPRYRGELTAAQYIGNVNDAIQFHGIDLPMELDQDGHWVYSDRYGSVVVGMLEGAPPDHQMILDENGTVRGVRLEVARTGEEVVAPPVLQQQLAAIALVAADRNFNCFTWQTSGVLSAIADQKFESYTLEAGGMTVTQTVEIQGYERAGDYLFAPDGTEEGIPSYRMEFIIERK